MKDIILKAIEEYINEPQGTKPYKLGEMEPYEIRSIPSPEVLAEWIVKAINEKLV